MILQVQESNVSNSVLPHEITIYASVMSNHMDKKFAEGQVHQRRG
jgi:hypothetical protein